MRSSNTSIDLPKMSASIATSSPGLFLSSTFKSEKKARNPGIEVAQNFFFFIVSTKVYCATRRTLVRKLNLNLLSMLLFNIYKFKETRKCTTHLRMLKNHNRIRETSVIFITYI